MAGTQLPESEPGLATKVLAEVRDSQAKASARHVELGDAIALTRGTLVFSQVPASSAFNVTFSKGSSNGTAAYVAHVPKFCARPDADIVEIQADVVRAGSVDDYHRGRFTFALGQVRQTSLPPRCFYTVDTVCVLFLACSACQNRAPATVCVQHCDWDRAF